MTNTPPPLWRSVLRICIGAAIIFLIAYGVHQLMNWVESIAQTLSPTSKALMLTSVVGLMLLAYALLIAIPFVPGIEIGLALLVLRGPPIAPYVFVATFVGLSCAFLVGRYLSYAWVHRTLLDFRLVKAATLLEQVQQLPGRERMTILTERFPGWIGSNMVRWRYLLVAVLINIPGNSVIGGGGGICMVAGLSRIFRPAQMLTTIAIAVSPVPIIVWFFGISILA